MALVRYIETFRPNLDEIKTITRRPLTESDLSSLTLKPMSESTKRYLEDHPIAVKEGKNVWRVPVSRYDWKNANGRIYPKALFENIITSQKEVYQGGDGLGDHPDDDKDASFKDSAVVWLNMGLDEDTKTVWGECIFIGAIGRLAEEKMYAGGRVGFSSSGFGELMEDGITVNPMSYILERVSDIVLNPSQNVFGNMSNKISKKESIETAPLKENTQMVEGTKPVLKISKEEERRFRKDAFVYIKEASEKEDLQERLQDYEEVLSYFQEGYPEDLKSEVLAKIKETKEEINFAIKEHTSIAKDLGVKSVKELKESIQRVAVDTQLYERTSEEWQKIAEGMHEQVKKLTAVMATMPTVEQYKNVSAKLKEVTASKTSLNEKYTAEIVKLKEALKVQTLLEKELTKQLNVISEEKQVEIKAKAVWKERAIGLNQKLKSINEASQKRVTEAVIAKKMSEQIDFRPKSTLTQTFAHFNESDKVAKYFQDQLKQYGKDILPFKESILSSKTLKEAMSAFMRGFSNMDTYQKVSEALPVEERKRIIESQTGQTVRMASAPGMRMPKSWE